MYAYEPVTSSNGSVCGTRRIQGGPKSKPISRELSLNRIKTVRDASFSLILITN